MANFKTHRNVGILTSVGATIALNQVGNTNIETLALMLLMGVTASLFPDIDLKTSKPFQFFKILFYVLLPTSLILLLFNNQDILNQYNNISFEIASLIIFISSSLVSYILLTFFSSQMIHRGLVHSVPYALTTAIIIYEVFNLIPYELNNLYIAVLWFSGFITHLLLDEIYSVDLNNGVIKKSFGSALSLMKFKNKFGSFIIYVLLIVYVSRIEDYSLMNSLM